MTVGIDKINFFTPNLYVDLVDLAEHRGIDPNKFTIGIGQNKMAVPPITQDTVALAANAAFPIVDESDAALIDLVILGTESGTDYSKAGAIYVHQLLGIQPFAKSYEIKQACYGATAGLMQARDYVARHPERKALVIASDISRYGLATSGEVTQGAGAVAMLVSSNPRILILEDDSVARTDNIFDFWRPNYSDTAFVDGKFSNEAYIHFFQSIWAEYQRRSGYSLEDFEAFCFHLPYSKMGKKALQTVIGNASDNTQKRLWKNYDFSTSYTKEVGNIYTGSLYLGLISLLDHHNELQPGQRIGFFSYGSGAVGEMFSGILADGFDRQIDRTAHQGMLDSRTRLTVAQYERIFSEVLPQDGQDITLENDYDNGRFYLEKIIGHKRHYASRN
ncbi:hydroxymethylglutaryl-CoA synthase [Vagococcus acidifermentans]|uniref:Hydroxymethylglutaryl-CoA synthase n=1 Tax=Vagococcus acidifermentans TaxID=564710 RepID=A0A430B0N0_9ENTE|nr:hydroxymethylglutaryl-CoA synthase [Vagococcus acidifermentans]RSU13859.1 hydroxymethylglutaryl-CoA synthase [Vagococcus acidifermentans]